MDNNDLPDGDLPIEPNGHFTQPPEIQRAVAAIAKTRVTEALFVLVAVIAALALVGTTAWNTYKVRTLTSQNVRAQNFGLQAVNCILENLAEHRWSNQVFHDGLADALKISRTPHTPLPNLPTEEEFLRDCAPFNFDKTVVSSTSTTMGVGHVTTTSR